MLGLAALPASALPAAGWERYDVPSTGSYFWRYIPASLDPSSPAPVIVFLHGAGSNPDVYKNFVAGSAETAKAVLVCPKSTGTSWGSAADEATLADSLAQTRAVLPLDADRTSIAGHSAGGAYAYLRAYASSTYNAVFTLAASYYEVAALADPGFKPPIRMYYGTTDPNYLAGPYASLRAQWTRLGVPQEEDIQPGFGHNTWPNASMRAGFQFLVDHPKPAAPLACVPAADVLCLQGGRFRVEVDWETPAAQGRGSVVPAGAASSGLFWFFSPENWELMVKVLDGCAVNGHYWVFSAATTDVRYRLTVTDTSNGRTATYDNAAGTAARAVTDTEALSVCP
jgi:predicted esterase